MTRDFRHDTESEPNMRTSSPVSDLVERLRGTHTCDGCGEYVGTHISGLLDEAASTLTTLSTHNAALEAQLAERVKPLVWGKADYERRFLLRPPANPVMTHEMANVRDKPAALDATPPAPKVTDELVYASLSAAYPQGWDLADKIRIQKALTAAQEAGKP